MSEDPEREQDRNAGIDQNYMRKQQPPPFLQTLKDLPRRRSTERPAVIDFPGQLFQVDNTLFLCVAFIVISIEL